MNILLINQPLNNRGDESAHKGLIRALNKSIPTSQINILFIGANPKTIAQFDVNLPNVRYLNIKGIKGYGKIMRLGLLTNFFFIWKIHPTLRNVIQIYKQAEIVICAPGGICMGGFQNWIHIFYLSMAKYLNKPLVYYSRSFGPFPTKTWSNKIFKKISLSLIHYFSFLSIRDYKTEKLAQEIGVNYIPTVDSAFLDYPKPLIPSEIEKEISNSKYIIFVPNLLIWHYAYKGHISKEEVLTFYYKMINLIIKQFPTHKILMLPQTFNYGTYEGDDIYFFKELKNMSNNTRIIVVSDQYSSDIQQAIIRKSTCMIGARYHSIVFAINNEVPFIALSYEHKIAGLLETLKYTDSMIDISTSLFTSEDREKTLDIFKEKLTSIKKNPNAQILAKSIAEDCFQKLLKKFIC